MKKLGLLVLLIVGVVMGGCVSTKMRTMTDPVSGNPVKYGYAWTTGADQLKKDFHVDTNISVQLAHDEVTGENTLELGLIISDSISAGKSLITTKTNRVTDVVTGREKYTKDITEFKFLAGNKELLLENPGGTIKRYDTLGTVTGFSQFKKKITDDKLNELNDIFNEERIVLMAVDTNGEEHFALVNDKLGILQILEYLTEKRNS